MRKQVRDVEYGIVFVLTDVERDFATVFEHHYTVKRKRNGEPLILFDTAVIVRFEIRHIRFFVERNLFEIESGTVHVRYENTHAVLCHVCLARADNEKSFSAIVVVEFVTGIDFVAEHVRLVALCFYHSDAFRHHFPLGLSVVEEFFVTFCIFADDAKLLLVRQRVNVLSFISVIHKSLTKFIFCQHYTTPVRKINNCAYNKNNAPQRASFSSDESSSETSKISAVFISINMSRVMVTFVLHREILWYNYCNKYLIGGFYDRR